MKLTDAQLSVVREHTLAVYPHEAVIAITETDAIPMANVHPDPENHFMVDSREFYYKHKGIALVHSHPVVLNKPRAEFVGVYADARIPSKLDMKSQMSMNVPFGILSCDGTEVSEVLWFPDLDSPLEGNPYISGVYDCYRVVRAYHWQMYGIHVNDRPRDYKWWEEDPDVLINYFSEYGFREISEDEMEPGDVLIIRLLGNHESHSAIYLGGDQFIHHLYDQISKIDNYSRWRRKVTRILRHKDKPNVSAT